MSAADDYRKERLRRGPDVDGMIADAAIVELEAELDALDARRCETCVHWYDQHAAAYIPRCLLGHHTGNPVDFACNRWEARS